MNALLIVFKCIHQSLRSSESNSQSKVIKKSVNLPKSKSVKKSLLINELLNKDKKNIQKLLI